MRTSLCVYSYCGALIIGLFVVGVLVPQECNATKVMYKCPEVYRRIGNGCYYLGDEKLTWHDAQFACRDLANGYLAKLNKRWKDRSMRRFLNRSEGVLLERWIGTIYDFQQHAWIWGAGGERLRYQGFSRRRPNDIYNWRCGIMDPVWRFRWGTRSCIEKKAFICEVPIKIVSEDGRKRKMMKHRKGKGKRLRGERRKNYDTAIETNRIT